MAIPKDDILDVYPMQIQGLLGGQPTLWVHGPPQYEYQYFQSGLSGLGKQRFDPRMGKDTAIDGLGGVRWEVSTYGSGPVWYCAKRKHDKSGAHISTETYGPHSYEMCMIQFDECTDQIYMTLLKDD